MRFDLMLLIPTESPPLSNVFLVSILILFAHLYHALGHHHDRRNNWIILFLFYYMTIITKINNKALDSSN